MGKIGWNLNWKYDFQNSEKLPSFYNKWFIKISPTFRFWPRGGDNNNNNYLFSTYLFGKNKVDTSKSKFGFQEFYWFSFFDGKFITLMYSLVFRYGFFYVAFSSLFKLLNIGQSFYFVVFILKILIIFLHLM